MKTPEAIEPNMNGRFSRYGFGHAVCKGVIALALLFLAFPSLLSAQTLLHRYSFATDASDSVGGANGTLVPPIGGTAATINNGLLLPGGGGDDYSGYVSLPSGILTTTTNITVECWMEQNTENTWATPWDFANTPSGTQNFALITYPGNNNNQVESAFTPSGGEQDLQSSILFPSGSMQYVAVTYNNSTLVGNIYINGTEVATKTFPRYFLLSRRLWRRRRHDRKCVRK